jgi:hypothetical protein
MRTHESVRNRPVLRALGAAVLAAALVAGCRGGKSGPPAGAAAKSGDWHGLRMTVSADKAVYAKREPVRMWLRVENPGEKPVQFNTSDWGPAYGIAVEDASGLEVWAPFTTRKVSTLSERVTAIPDGHDKTGGFVCEGLEKPGAYTVVGRLRTSTTTLRVELPIEVK